MIAVDTNILVYAHREDHPLHDGAAAAIRTLAESSSLWGIPWPCLHEFLAIVTHPRVFKTPTPLPQAVVQIDAWLESPSLTLLAETEPYWPRLRRSLLLGRIVGPQTHDARIAAICGQHGVTVLWTADRDYSRFPALNAVNPLVAPSPP